MEHGARQANRAASRAGAPVRPATYRVVAWALDSNESRAAQPIEVTVGATVTAETLNVQYTPRSHVHPRVDGREYD